MNCMKHYFLKNFFIEIIIFNFVLRRIYPFLPEKKKKKKKLETKIL